MTDASGSASAGGTGAFAPLRQPVFRNIWIASLFSNLAQLILGVGAAWEMTHLTTSASMVAAVQTALMVPMMIFAVPAGAIADMFDRRKIAMSGLAFSIAGAAVLTVLAYLGYTSPWVLLLFCVIIGAGVAIFAPSWQSSIREQVEPEQLPAAVALGSISYNIARSFGPALGGVIVLAWGAKAAFNLTTVSYIPLFITFWLWKRAHVPSRLPPERIDRAILSGMRYAFHSPPIRRVLGRALLFGLATASYSALGALIARDLLHGNAGTYGLLLGASGVGAVVGALAIQPIRDGMGTENALRWSALISAGALAAMGLSTNVWITAVAFFFAGGVNILTVSLMNVAVQLAAPRWVTARALSLFTSALTGGIAIGAILWGEFASAWSVEVAMVVSGGALLLTGVVGFALPLIDTESQDSDLELVEFGYEPDVALDISLRSGPIVIEVDYDVDPAQAREFYGVMLKVQRIRQRNGGFSWQLSRAIGNPWAWTERFECPTWGDYLRLRDRNTHADREVQAQADAYHHDREAPRVRRQLARPFGSVRWRAETPDPRQDTIGIFTP
ncbi:MFS transporter [Sphingobium sufflavum]|uniref:MFS transporter n=1 Tax=Sphingobium sufflavum TaxID=1129547 RepID=UPI001F1900AC|nr:MFS transporter [Sphingobium sufflavum]MCE7796801.1 MFS transporter [Sphingobium sufflavum]